MLEAAFAAERRNDAGAAVRQYAKLTEQYPDFPAGWHYYGLLLHRQGGSDQALQALYRAHRLEPDNPLYLANVAQVLRETGDVEQALACLHRAHELDPDHAQILSKYAQLLLACGRGEEILPELERHLERASAAWHLWLLVGHCREQGGDKVGAYSAYGEAARQAPAGEAAPFIRMGILHRKYDEPAGAEASFGRALERAADSGQAYLGLANIAAQRGDFGAARDLCRKALAGDPNLYAIWGFLANIGPGEDTNSFVAELESAVRAAAGDPQRWPLHFALGRAYELLKDYDRAFSDYATGNALAAPFRPYHPDAEEAGAENIRTRIDAEFIGRAARIGQAGSGAIFICGMPRSGTTLLETILGSHPDVAMGGEMRFLGDWLMRHTRIGAGRENVGDWLRSAGDDILRDLAAEWRGVMRQTAGETRLVTDKMPGNFRNLGLIATCLPDAQIVYVKRNALDNCLSCFTTGFAEGHNYSYTLEALGHYYQLHASLIEHWHRVLGPDRILTVEYESLIRDPGIQVRRLLAHLGLAWEPRCLTPHKTERYVATASIRQVRQPIYSHSAGRWRRFEHHLLPLQSALSRPLGARAFGSR